MSEAFPKTMTLQEFRDKGFLQEVNRLLLNPVGISLSVEVDDETGQVTRFGPIWDYRDDPEGLIQGGFSIAKSLEYRRLLDEKVPVRHQKYGGVIQNCELP